MTKKLGFAATLCAVVAACGNNSGGNAAASRTFTYGSATTASAEQLSALDVSRVVTQKTSPDASSAVGLVDVSGTTSALLGSSVGYLSGSSAQQQALAYGTSVAKRELITPSSGAFDNPACVTSTSTSVTLSGCTITINENSATAKVNADGNLKVSGDTLTWDVTIKVSFTETSSITGSASYHDSGTLTVTSTTVKGSMLAELDITATANGQTQSFGVDESLNLDVTYDPNCPTGVTGGTLEAKRVFTARPSSYTATNLPDRGAKVTWTGCGTGMFALSQ